MLWIKPETFAYRTRMTSVFQMKNAGLYFYEKLILPKYKILGFKFRSPTKEIKSKSRNYTHSERILKSSIRNSKMLKLDLIPEAENLPITRNII